MPPSCAAREEARYALRQFWKKRRRGPSGNGVSMYDPRSTDVVIATVPKSGTTLLQNMAYQIVVATGGAPPFDPDGTNFTDSNNVSPWLDFGHHIGAMDVASHPRVFKTHREIGAFDLSKSKFIYCIRDPLRIPASYLDFLWDAFSDVVVEDTEIREQLFQEFVRQYLLHIFEDEDTQLLGDAFPSGMHWFDHVRGWTKTPRQNVLVLFYEDLVKDLRGTALCVAKFMECNLSANALQTVVDRCDRNAMLKNPAFSSGKIGELLGTGNIRKVMPENREGFNKKKICEESLTEYRALMRSVFGVESYSEMKSNIQRQQRNMLAENSYAPAKFTLEDEQIVLQ